MYRMRIKKKRLNLSINDELINKARDKGINLSAFLEIKLQEHLALLEGNLDEEISIDENEKIFWLRFFLKKAVWTERDLNPRPLPCEGSDLPS